MKRWQRFLGSRLGTQTAILALLALGLVAGCATENYNPYMLPGAGIGAALGAGLGAVASPGNPWKGAAIGGLLGTAVGGVGGEMYGRSKPYPYPQQQQPQGYYQQPQQPYYGQQQPNYGQPSGSYGPPPQAYRTPPAADDYAYNEVPPEPPTNMRTPITKAPYSYSY